MADITFPTYMCETDFSDGAVMSLGETSLRVGEVVGAFAPGDNRNRDENTRNQWVYLVNVAYRNNDGAYSKTPYRCTVMDAFGSLTDHYRHTVRPATGQTEGRGSPFGKGARVLVLCPNGDKSNSFIIGGMRHEQDKTPDPTTTFLDFLFNGVHASIDAAGAFVLEVPGSPDGQKDSNNHGSKVTFAKDGTVTVDDQTGQKAVLDPGGEKVEVYGKKVTVFSDNVQLGGDNLTEQNDGVVVADGVDYFTGLTYFELQNTSKKVRAKR